MRQGGLLFILLLIVCQALAQNTRYGTIKGTVIDSTNRLPVEAATISVFLIADSSLINYAITNRKGEFLVKDIPVAKACRLLISSNGFKSYEQDFQIPAGEKEMVITPVPLNKAYDVLDEVIVVRQRPPMLIKKDTIEFNASAFRTMPNAVLEDLLKQLPGVDVDKDGKITINGKKLSKIMIDGKEFFGNDPEIALKNLPRDIIDKIQVVDDKTKQQQFDKTRTGKEDKVLNLTLKKEMSNGWFGRVAAGYGTDRRYEAGANINYFKEGKQLNFIASAGNTNRNNAASSGSFSMANAQSSFTSEGSGITESKAAGLNFSNVLSKKLSVNGSYFYNNAYAINNTSLQRQNILPDTSFLYNSDNQNANDNRSHRANVSIDYKPDTALSMYLNTFYNRSDGAFAMHNNAASLSMKGATINTSENSFTGTNNSNNLGTEFFIGRRFRKEGRALSFTLAYNYSDQSSHDNNIGGNVYFKPDGTSTADTINQESRSNNTNHVLGLSLSYAEPLMKSLVLLMRYNYRANISDAAKTTHRFNPLTGKYDQEDSLFTNDFRNNSIAHNPDISLAFTREKFRVNMGMGVQWLMQENITKNNTDLKQRYTSIFPNASVAYQFSKSGELSLYYNGGSQQPTVQQLQPVPDNSNPLYVQLGNPDLKPSFFHNIVIGIQQANSNGYLYGNLNLATTSDQIITETYFDSLGRQVSRPLNTNGNYAVSSTFVFSTSRKKRGWAHRFNASISGGFNRDIVYTNKVENISKTYLITPRVGWSGTYKELITIMPSYGIRYNNTRYSVQENPNSEFVTHTFTMDLFWNWPKRLILENNIQYLYNSSIAPGFRKGVTMWNAAVNYQVFKDRRGTIRLAAYDLLKQNTNVYRTVTQTYIQDMQVQVLQRYYLLSFIYNLRKFGGR